MKVCIFIDGQNFYRSLLRYDENLRVDYDRLALWITHAVGGASASFEGAYYYVGVSPGAPALVEAFLKGLELRPGYFVKREPRVRRGGRCPACGADYEYTTEKRVDTRLVADMCHFAAIGAFDTAVLVSGDDDFVPAVEAVNLLGRRVWVATWSADDLSIALRVKCFGHLHLSEGLPAFRAERARHAGERGFAASRGDNRGPSRSVAPLRAVPASPVTAITLDRAVAELQRAEARLPHVSRGYFVTRWKSHQLPPAGHEREELVQQMLAAGVAEQFDVVDASGRSVTAIRSREPNGNIAPSPAPADDLRRDDDEQPQQAI